MTALSATIFAIKRYALHDGPHIRTTIFFKGCPLACHWCHNPEGMDFRVEILSLTEKCVGCRECLEKCPAQVLQLTPDGIRRDENRCTLCRTCTLTCPALAHESTGRQIGVGELVAEITKDLPFFDQSGGGITCSGGEPLCQPEFLYAFLTACGALGIHRAVDTSGFAPTETLLRIATVTDLFLFDVKLMDSKRHELYTGVTNDLIFGNLKALAATGKPIRLRLPVIAGVNADEENIRAAGALAADCRVEGIDVLPYHPSATAKYRKLKKIYQGKLFTAPSGESLARIVEILQQYSDDVRIGG
ncbi:MAG TPA: glycyl-radical enzyme activating protein [Desulfobulbaceae bacterium]|nr:glycyl-radical enzyme activating protein [Desulfobulbaceae bacterium]